MIPTEIQGHIRHILHTLGMALASYGGISQSQVEIYAGVGVSLISVGWYIFTRIQNKS